ncbi:hypothetical protein A2774_02435 [Candidatus Roizmanbacteria bacterium RIFCSPHIGHO2_01_FULL_39_12c]|uniref:Uncharacterized protein n=1 Tax=Candidatus Roizmanbacteria bacterium RIFCSPHIGHO2_01_FULL_39_12c TaxID=1802031 RepID=A0A1F7G8M2_9BACT|nr:MAG: hypothetical protein A2774_02435 [Candidatus Roizmanbacteria bacterium RIFCSPHIGHO2_01_FULL_39_12c]OGK47725.1 MAG: hypothetical protein A2963_00525 [Candidatus Roizmanbacteria bacterium RIFCSPLOWO2_01_FULL_40_13]
MSKKNNSDAIDIFSKLKKTLAAKPSLETMYQEVRMMRFKIRPISGDISLLKLRDHRLIETLWGLGKLDEVFQREYNSLSRDQQEVFFRLIDSLYQQYQMQLNKIPVSSEYKSSIPKSVEMEIFKEILPKKKSN